MGSRNLAACTLDVIALGMENSDVADLMASSTIFPLNNNWLLFFAGANSKDVLSASCII